MDVVKFFTETLSGPWYIVLVVVNVILIFAIIGFMAERKIKNKKEQEKYVEISSNDNKSESIEKVKEEVVVNPFDMREVDSSIIEDTVEKPSIKEVIEPTIEEKPKDDTTLSSSIPEIVINEPVNNTIDQDSDII